MHGRILVAYFAVVLAWGVLLTGCGENRELIGAWTAVNTGEAPSDLRQMTFADEHHMRLANGDLCEYTAISESLVRITFPSGQTYDYGYSRSGEYLTLVDGARRIPYMLNQG